MSAADLSFLGVAENMQEAILSLHETRLRRIKRFIWHRRDEDLAATEKRKVEAVEELEKKEEKRKAAKVAAEDPAPFLTVAASLLCSDSEEEDDATDASTTTDATDASTTAGASASTNVVPDLPTMLVDASTVNTDLTRILSMDIAAFAGNRDIPTAITDAIANNPDIITAAITDSITNDPATAKALTNFVANAIANPEANAAIVEALHLQFVAHTEAGDIATDLLGRGPPTVAPWNHIPPRPPP